MKTNTMNLSSADLLAHALLCMPDGPELETVIRNIHRFIFVNGRTGHAELTQAIDGMLYRTFRRARRSFQVRGGFTVWSSRSVLMTSGKSLSFARFTARRQSERTIC